MGQIVSAAQIRRHIDVRDKTVMSLRHVAKWYRKFSACRERDNGDDRSGWPCTAAT